MSLLRPTPGRLPRGLWRTSRPAIPARKDSGPVVDAFANLLPFVLIAMVFYLLVIRPSRNRQREHLRLQASLAPGQEVMTTSGLIGTVAAVEDAEVLLEAAPGVTLRWAKPAIARVLPKAEPGSEEAAEQREDESDAPVPRAD